MKYTKEMDEFLYRQKTYYKSWNQIKNNFNAEFKTNLTGTALRSRLRRNVEKLQESLIKKPSEILWNETAMKIIEKENAENERKKEDLSFGGKPVEELPWQHPVNESSYNQLIERLNELEKKFTKESDLIYESSGKAYQEFEREFNDKLRRLKQKMQEIETRIPGQTGEYDLQDTCLNIINRADMESKMRKYWDDNIYKKIKENYMKQNKHIDARIKAIHGDLYTFEKRLSQLETKAPDKAEIIPVETRKEQSPIVERVKSMEPLKRVKSRYDLKVGMIITHEKLPFLKESEYPYIEIIGIMNDHNHAPDKFIIRYLSELHPPQLVTGATFEKVRNSLIIWEPENE